MMVIITSPNSLAYFTGGVSASPPASSEESPLAQWPVEEVNKKKKNIPVFFKNNSIKPWIQDPIIHQNTFTLGPSFCSKPGSWYIAKLSKEGHSCVWIQGCRKMAVVLDPKMGVFQLVRFAYVKNTAKTCVLPAAPRFLFVHIVDLIW